MPKKRKADRGMVVWMVVEDPKKFLDPHIIRAAIVSHVYEDGATVDLVLFRRPSDGKYQQEWECVPYNEDRVSWHSWHWPDGNGLDL